MTTAPAHPWPGASAPAGESSGADLGPLWSTVVRRRTAVGPFVTVACLLIVAGGLTAAVSRPFDWELGPWVAGYLVLVGGIAQTSLAVGQAHLARRSPSRAMVWVELLLWNLASVATIAGSLLGIPLLSTVGGVATVGSLACFLVATWSCRPGARSAAIAYRAIIAVVLLSAPIGIGLSWVRHG